MILNDHNITFLVTRMAVFSVKSTHSTQVRKISRYKLNDWTHFFANGITEEA